MPALRCSAAPMSTSFPAGSNSDGWRTRRANKENQLWKMKKHAAKAAILIAALSIILITIGNLYLYDSPGTPPQSWDAIRCFVDNVHPSAIDFRYSVPTLTPVCSPTNGGFNSCNPYESANSLEEGGLIRKRYGDSDLLCSQKVRVVYPDNIFEEKVNFTTKILNSGGFGFEATTYHSGAKPKGFDFPKDRSTDSFMWSIGFRGGTGTRRYSTTYAGGCMGLSVLDVQDVPRPGDNENRKNVEFSCEIYNKSALIENRKYVNKEQTILYAGNYVGKYTDKTHDYEGGKHVYTNGKKVNTLFRTLVWVGIFLLGTLIGLFLLKICQFLLYESCSTNMNGGGNGCCQKCLTCNICRKNSERGIELHDEPIENELPPKTTNTLRTETGSDIYTDKVTGKRYKHNPLTGKTLWLD